MEEKEQENITSLQKWVEEQVNWLNKQIEMMEVIKKELLISNDPEFLEKYSEQIISQNDKLQNLLDEFALLRKRIGNQSIINKVLNKEKNAEIKNLIDKLIKINQEVFDTILTLFNKYKKEIEELQSYRERFTGYTDSEKHLPPGNRVDYDI